MNWWLKPLEFHLRDPSTKLGRVLKLLIRPIAIREPSPQLNNDDFTALSSDNDNEEEMVEYHQLLRSDPSVSDGIVVSSEDETEV